MNNIGILISGSKIMKLRSVKWQNHPVLGNLELSFLRPDGTVYDNIVLIGENGSGKTSVMESIVSFLNIGPFDVFEYLEFETNGGIYRALHRVEGQVNKTFFKLRNMADGEEKQINTDKSNAPTKIASTPEDPRSYGCAISKARANYRTEKIKHTTTSKLDDNKYSDDNNDNFTSLNQMFVDIVAQDEHDYTVINEGKDHAHTITVENFRLNHSKQYRFVRAFDNFFIDRGLKYGKVEDLNGNKEILFEKGANKISVDNLSTGEKQIVYRGMFLLKNFNVLSGTVVFVDEPELSMHPRWQKKILPFYEDLFKDGAGNRTSQMFFATHSNFVVDSAFSRPEDHLVIMLSSDANGVVSRHYVNNADRVLPRVSSAEINYLAFHLPTVEYHVELFGYLQIKAGNMTIARDFNVKETDDYIKNHTLYNAAQHYKQYVFNRPGGRQTTYDTLCSYIRNCIDHPNPAVHPTPTEDEMKRSIELLRELCR